MFNKEVLWMIISSAGLLGDCAPTKVCSEARATQKTSSQTGDPARLTFPVCPLRVEPDVIPHGAAYLFCEAAIGWPAPAAPLFACSGPGARSHPPSWERCLAAGRALQGAPACAGCALRAGGARPRVWSYCGRVRLPAHPPVLPAARLLGWAGSAMESYDIIANQPVVIDNVRPGSRGRAGGARPRVAGGGAGRNPPA